VLEKLPGVAMTVCDAYGTGRCGPHGVSLSINTHPASPFSTPPLFDGTSTGIRAERKSGLERKSASEYTLLMLSPKDVR
jgi:hypothetical protein